MPLTCFRRLARLPCEVQLLSRSHVVQTSHGQSVWRTFDLLRLLLCFALNGGQSVDKSIEVLLGFRLRGFDQEALRHEQREVRRRRMKSVIQQPLRKIHCVDAELPRLPLQRDDEFVTRTTLRIGSIESCL